MASAGAANRNANGGNNSSKFPFIAGEGDAANIFSHLNAEHSFGVGILGFLTAANASALAQTSKRGAQVVREFEWADNTRIKGKLADWHSRFPNATTANLQGRTDLVDSDFIYLRGIKKLNISGCTGITDLAFEQIRGVEELDMSDLPQITDAALTNLVGIHIFNMSGCTGITGSTFESITGVYTLNISGCTGIRGEHFEHLSEIFELNVELAEGSSFFYPYINSSHFRLLKGIHTLNISNIKTLTDDTFTKDLSSLQHLYMNSCEGITGIGFRFLTDIKLISMRSVRGAFDSRNFRYISNTIEVLDISDCIVFSDTAFEHFKHLKILNMTGCNQRTITDAAFTNLGNLEMLYMSRCNQLTITDAAFEHIANIHGLVMVDCNQPTITPAGINKLVEVSLLSTRGCRPEVIAAAEALLEAHRARQGGGKRKVNKKAAKRSRKARKIRKNRRTQRR